MTTHSHHWDIEPGIGPTSTGICHNCGLVKAFSNHLVLTMYSASSQNLQYDETGHCSG